MRSSLRHPVWSVVLVITTVAIAFLGLLFLLGVVAPSAFAQGCGMQRGMQSGQAMMNGNGRGMMGMQRGMQSGQAMMNGNRRGMMGMQCGMQSGQSMMNGNGCGMMSNMNGMNRCATLTGQITSIGPDGTLTVQVKPADNATDAARTAVSGLKAGDSISLMMMLDKAKPGTAGTTDTATNYTCPMHPEVTSDRPGQCPKCGMNLQLVNQGK